MSETCDTFPVIIKGRTTALCTLPCDSVKNQDIVKCTTDNLCQQSQ